VTTAKVKIFGSYSPDIQSVTVFVLTRLYSFCHV